MKDFIIYGAGGLGLCLIVYGLGCTVRDHFRDRREDMRQARAIRLGRMAHGEFYSIAPEAPCLEPEEFEDFFDLVDLSDDPEFIRDGIELLSLHATWSQRPGDELAA